MRKETKHLVCCRLAEVDIQTDSPSSLLTEFQKKLDLSGDALLITAWDNRYEFYNSLGDDILIHFLLEIPNRLKEAM